MALESQKAKRNYQKEYRCRHRDEINLRQRRWRAANPEKVKEYRRRYQERLSGRRNIRASWSDYGIDKKRLRELREIARNRQYDEIVQAAANKANELAAAHIILSVMRNLSYEALEAKYASGKIEKVPLGRSDFYGVRRLFFHYLDVVLKELEKKGEEK